VRPRDRERAESLDVALRRHSNLVRGLPGISDPNQRAVLVEQIIDSIRRVEYAKRLPEMKLSSDRANPESIAFDPLKAAVFQYRQGQIDEAFWLVFLFVHFGKDRMGGWSYAKSVYGQLDQGQRWDWASVSANPAAFRAWLAESADALKQAGGGFGNHRKYMSLNAYSTTGSGAAVETYVDWILSANGHATLIDAATEAAEGDSKAAFDILYRSMQQVAGFGRTGRFDYLTMLGKLGFAPVEPGRAYLGGATGPLSGARLLFGDRSMPATLDEWLVELDMSLEVGMQVLEDALCNWQKSPDKYTPFRG
jgi:hypothetical protein